MAERGRGGVLLLGLELLEQLAEESGGLGVTELARRVSRDKANVHRVLRILLDAGYVAQDSSSRRYRHTPQISELAGRSLRRLDIRSAADPGMRLLRDRTGESVHLAAGTSHGGVYIAQVRAPNRLNVETEIGASPPLHCTATGRALTAYAEAGELARMLEGERRRYTDRTPVADEDVHAQLEAVRCRGFATDDEEYTPGVRCVAAPIFGEDGGVIAAIGISGPVERIPTERLDPLGAAVRDIAIRISQVLGADPPALCDSEPAASRVRS